MRVVGYVVSQVASGMVRVVSVHGFPSTGLLLWPGRPGQPVSLAHPPTDVVSLEYGSVAGQGVPKTRVLTSDSSEWAGPADVVGALVAAGYSAPIATERRCRVALTLNSILPFEVDPQTEADYKARDNSHLLALYEKQRLQPQVSYPVEVAPSGAAVQYRGPFAETVGLDYGVLTLTNSDPAGVHVGLLQVVEERDSGNLSFPLDLYRFGRLIGKAELT